MDLRSNHESEFLAGRGLIPVPPPLLPPKGFDPERYMELNPDVKGTDPARHWQEYGYKEGRKLR